ncbi:MAG TPA: DUF1707 domain-containing protein [Gemmatimonadaceae bacterium]
MTDHSKAITRAPTNERREEVAQLLARGFAEDALTLDQFEERVAAVWRAGSESELSALVADLRREPALPAPAAPPLPVAPKRVRVVLGNHERGGALELPARLDISVLLGNAELDFRDATIPAGVTEIAIDVLLGNVEITLPAGVSVENHGIGILGTFECRPPAGAPRRGAVRITGRSTLSAVTIRFAEPNPAYLRAATE